MKQVYLLASLLFSFSILLAQKNGTVKGICEDTLAKQPVAGATITLMHRKDSSLVSFTMADNGGRFELRGLGPGDYRLLITHINYHNSNRYFSISERNNSVDLGNLVLHDSKKVLPEVVVSAEAPPVTMIADTIQYNAGSFRVQPNANVEDLLKKLPGVKVEKDGTVKAQGEKVNKVLVDGKEFFGNDPKIATRNLPADAVDKVQVYDRMSDQAQLTGFDDGNSEKTINLKLKKDKKKGLFGKATGGYGTNERYEGRLNMNSFKGARQMSVIGMANNANVEGFSFMDMLNFTGEMNRLRMGASGGNVNINISSNDANFGLGGGNPNTGINTTMAGGINYNNIIGTKTDFQSNYFYSRFNPVTESRQQRQYFLPDSFYFYDQSSINDNLSNNHRLNINADIAIDSFHSIKISPSIGFQDSRNSSQREYTTLAGDMRINNEGVSNYLSNNNGFNLRNDVLFRKKFRRRGRSFSIALQSSYNESDGEGSLQSINRFYDPAGAVIKTDSINQRNTTTGNLLGYNIRAVYTEPVLKRSLLEFSTSYSNSFSSSEKITYDYNSQSGKFDELNNLLTNDFENTYGYTQAGIRFRTQQKKYNWTIGINHQWAQLEGTINIGGKDSIINKTFLNWLPNARFQYNFTRYRSLVMNYSTSTTQPTITQLQPVPDNSDPLNIKLGNPNLKQEFSQAMRLHFSSINPFKNKNLFIFLSLFKTDNKIVNYDVVNQNGIKTSLPVNINGIYNLNGDINWGIPVRFMKAAFQLGAQLGYSRNKNFINASENTINNYSIGPNLQLDMNLTEKITWSLSARLNINKAIYSLQESLNTNYVSQQYSTDFSWQLPARFFLATDFTYTVNNQINASLDNSVPFWNASISKQFLRFNRGELKLRVFDLLNQNAAVYRNANQNYIEDINIRNLRRYFMLSFTYSLNKNGLSQGMGAGGMRVISR